MNQRIVRVAFFTGVDEGLTPEWNILPESDLIISIGLSAREVLSVKPFPCPSIHVGDHQSSGIEGFNFQWTLGKDFLPEMVAILSEKLWGMDRLTGIKNRLREKLIEGFLPGRVFQDN